MILANIAGLARPVRIVARSSLANSIARSIFSSASKSVSSITWVSLQSLVVAVQDGFCGDERADPLTSKCPDDGVVTLGSEDQHRQFVVPAQAQRGRVRHPQS